MKKTIKKTKRKIISAFFKVSLLFIVNLYITEPVFAETAWETSKETDTVQNDGSDCTFILEAYSGKVPTSYLIPIDTGWMAVHFARTSVALNASGQIMVYTFDKNFHVVNQKVIFGELPVWGGFYSAPDAYYIVTGQNNPDEDDSLEVFRITKYDLNWNRIKSARLNACNTTYPFGYGCRMDLHGKNLVIHTSHTMYKSYDGLRHQANATILVDTDIMEVKDTVVGVGGAGYVSHSFDQYVGFDDNSVVMVDLGDGYPRAVTIYKLNHDISDGQLQKDNYSLDGKRLNIMDVYGKKGDAYLGASLGGFEIMNDSYIVVGNSVIQDETFAERKTKNIFIASIDKDLEYKNISWITSYAEGDGTVTTPQIVKISNDNCMLLWSRQNTVYYTIIDETGNQISQIYQHKGYISSCKPILYQDRIYWFTVDGYSIDFYSLSLTEPNDFIVKETCNGHQCKVEKTSFGMSYAHCIVCNQEISLKVPVQFEPWWNLTGKDESVIYYNSMQTSSSVPIEINVGDKIYFTFDALELNINISDESKLSYVRDEYDGGYYTALADGNVKVSMNPKWNPDLMITFKVRIGDVLVESSDKDIDNIIPSPSFTPVTMPSPTSTIIPTAVPITFQTMSPIVTPTPIIIAQPSPTSIPELTSEPELTPMPERIPTSEPITNTNSETDSYNDIKKEITISDVTLKQKIFAYNGKKKKPDVTVVNDSLELMKNKDYTVSYLYNRDIGTAYVIVDGKGDYYGSVVKNFKIIPKGTSIESNLKPKRKGFTIKWKKQPKFITGYQVQYSTSKKFKDNKTVTKIIEKKNITQFEVDELKAKKKYYVRVRTYNYKISDGNKYYSKWSKFKTVITK